MNQSKISQSSDLYHTPFITTAELAYLLKRKPQTIRKWLCNDQLPSGLVRPTMLNNRNYWFKEDIDNYLSSLKDIAFK